MNPTAAYQRERRRKWAERVGYDGTRRPWMTSEQRIALDMKARGKSSYQIALRVGRTPDAVAARLRYISTTPGGRDAPQCQGAGG